MLSEHFIGWRLCAPFVLCKGLSHGRMSASACSKARHARTTDVLAVDVLDLTHRDFLQQCNPTLLLAKTLSNRSALSYVLLTPGRCC